MQRHPARSGEHDRSNSLELGLLLDDEEKDRSKGTHNVWCRRHIRRLGFTWSQRKYVLGKYVLMSIICLIFIVLPITRTLGVRIRPRIRKTAVSALAKPDVPYPASSVKVSVIVMNHARPNLLQHSELLPVLTQHPTIGEILILHSNPATAFTNQNLQHVENSHKIQNLMVTELNEQMGLAVRFHYCAVAAANEWVIHIDDDMELDASAINEMVLSMVENPKRIIGHYGRAYNYWTSPFRHGYDTKDVTGNVEVVLTKVLILEKIICREFWKHAPLMDDMIPESHPRWNGEDIFVNLVANHYYGVPVAGPYNNLAIADLNVWDADTELYPENPLNSFATEEVAISGNMDRNRIWIVGPIFWWKAYLKAQGHTAYRGRMWYLAKRRLAGKIG
jgi:Glycosyl transferase family 64 domain